MSFNDLGLIEPIARAVSEKGYTTPSPIQAKSIPVVLQGKDLMASAQTGTGKTAAFVLPLLQQLASGPRPGAKNVRALIVTPTRELAAQIQANIDEYSTHLRLSNLVVFGGVNIRPQIRTLQRGVDILVATPGRLLDLHGQHAVNLSEVDILVLDEADRMLDMGFIHDIRRIQKLLPKKKQSLLFSATFSPEIRQLAKTMLHQPVEVDVAPRNTTVETVSQRIHPVDKGRKSALLQHLILDNQWQQVLVFSRTKHGANKLVKTLLKADIPAVAIHGNKSQAHRTRALADFKAGKVDVMVATDIAARGIDIADLPHVINFDLPNVPEDYVHRIGRTGRANATGVAISFVDDRKDAKLMRPLLRLLEEAKQKVPEKVANLAGGGGGHRGGGGGGRGYRGGGGGRSGGRGGAVRQTGANTAPLGKRRY